MTDGPVLAATAWNTNADMIVDCVRLGYLQSDWWTLDATYGQGNWWKKWRPDRLMTNDIDPQRATRWHCDFRSLVFPENTFDAVTFDPPYVCIGGRKGSAMSSMHAAYGMTDAPRTPNDLQVLIKDGLRECHRVLKPGGILLSKVQDYVSSGKLWPGTHHTLSHALYVLDMTLVDRLEHIAKAPRPQPSGRRQVHARRNLSTLLVLRKEK